MISEMYLLVISFILVKYIKKISVSDNLEAIDLLNRNIRLNRYLELKIERSEI